MEKDKKKKIGRIRGIKKTPCFILFDYFKKTTSKEERIEKPE